MQIAEWLRASTEKLQPISSSPRLDSELLLCEVLQKNRSYLFTWPEKSLSTTQEVRLEQLLGQRYAGKPIAYILGQREFWGLSLHVNEHTLIPRPETELLVECALNLLPTNQPRHILELGTGTGAIALAIASERPLTTITATDKSTKALAIAHKNRQQHQLKNIHFMESDWFEQLHPNQRFDLIISNPPYIAAEDPHLQQGDVRFEPMTALRSGLDGLDDIKILIEQAPNHLKPQATLVFEHGYDQRQVIAHLLQQAGYRHCFCQQDLAGYDRISGGQCPTI